jgi:hypothetical protein
MTANSVILTSDSGSMITFNGETKASGSTWTGLTAAHTYTDAYAYMPEDETHYQSPNSTALTFETKSRSSSSSTSIITNGSTEVIVNGNVEIAGTETIENVRGYIVVNVNVNADTVIKKIDSVLEENGSSEENMIEVPVFTEGLDRLSVVLTGDIVKKMGTENFELAVESDGIDYIVPAEEINIDSVADELDVSREKLEKIEIVVNIDKVEDSLTERIIEDGENQGYSIVFPPVEFSVTALTTYTNGKTKEVMISKFSKYVERIIEIPA